mmetsp:Transcript_4541/g.11416  ORF Transcript_4541/g.11416 Transcript_4541/m.11416 type:complete len:638 (-) Transcript_4541:2782-4695(-)
MGRSNRVNLYPRTLALAVLFVVPLILSLQGAAADEHGDQAQVVGAAARDVSVEGGNEGGEHQKPKEGSGGVKFEKTIAAQFEKALAKEFTDAEDTENAGVLGEGAGRSFNQTVGSEGAVLETVVRVSRSGGSKTREVRGGSGNGGPAGQLGSGGHNATTFQDGALPGRPESLFERIGFTAKDIERALGGSKDEEEDVERLVDSSDNEFVISNPKSGTMELQQDLRLISDLVIILVSSAIGALAFTLMGQPLITGYLIAGSFVGPGGMGLVVELVQVETLAQFGIIFLLFALGVEFSFSKLRHVQGVAVFGGTMQILLMMLVCGVISDFTGAPSKEGVFVGAFLSMSSTAVVVKCLMERNGMQSLHGQITVGTLILQDCTIGLLFALLPVLGGSHGIGEGVISLLRTTVLMCAFLGAAVALSRSLVGRLFRLVSPHSGELYQMVAVAFCLTVAWISEHLGLSIELGAFVAGVMVSATPFAEQTLHHIEPIRNVFAALFLASIGMIMNPFFLWVHLDVLLATLLVVIVFKCSLITLVVRAFGYTTRTSFTVGMSMAQVGEFSFVLLSRASNLGLVQRKLYLLLLGTTALSLVATPVMFRSTPYMLRFAFLARWIKREDEEVVHNNNNAVGAEAEEFSKV